MTRERPRRDDLVDIDPDLYGDDDPEPEPFEQDAAAVDDVARRLGW